MAEIVRSTKYADTGFRPDYSPSVSSSDIGPVLLAAFAALIFLQGLVYVLRPEMTGRSVTMPKEKVRRLGFLLMIGASVGLYIAFSWWIMSWSIDPAQVSP